MINSRWWKLLAAALILVLLLVACGDDEKDDDPSVADDAVVIKLVVNPWVATELNAQVAKILLEDELNYRVEFVPLDTLDQFDALAAGDAHAVLEVWPSGYVDQIQSHVYDNQTIEHGGELGPVGQVGWWTPIYMWDRYPELRTWEGFMNPELAALYATEDTGDRGRFVGGVLSWQVRHDAEIIGNLGLPLQVINAESEDEILAELDAAYNEETPVLFHMWTPHWIHAIYNVGLVSLPPYSDECYAKEAEGGIDCAYPPDPLIKLFWPGLKDYAPDAYAFLKVFNYDNRAQIGMLAQVEIDNLSPAEAAQKWVDDNKDTWEVWLVD